MPLRRAAALLVLALSLALGAASSAHAAPVTFPSDPGFETGTTWTSTATCGLLCATSATQPTTGGNPNGAAVASYATILNLLGLATGTVTFNSASFTWTGGSPASATLHADRKAAIGNLIAVNGGAISAYNLVDVTAASTTALKSGILTANDAGYVGVDVTVPASLLVAGHTYKLQVVSTFSAAVAVAGGASISYDNVKLTATRKAPVLSGGVTGTPSSSGVTLGAVADTAGVDGTYRVQYGTTTSYGSATADAAVSGASSPAPISRTLSGLAAATTYHARFVVTTDGGTTYGPDVTFTTAAAATPPPPVVPTVGAVTATANGVRALDLSAMVAPNGLTGTQYRFAYGTTTSYGSTTAATAIPAADGSGWSVVSAALTGLTPGTTYHVRAEVLSGGTWTAGADTTVATGAAQAPSVGTPNVVPATDGAQVSAAITPHSASVDWHVEYGLTNAYGSSTATLTIPAGEAPVQAVAQLAGLTDGTTYHFRFVATGPDGTTNGPDQTLTTIAVVPPTPAVTAATGSNVAAHAFDVTAQADVAGLNGTQYRFAYGATNTYGSTTAPTAVPAADGSGYSTLQASLSSLAAGSTYHVRAEVLSGGTWYPGTDATVATAAAIAAVIGTPMVTATTSSAHVATTITPGTGDVSWHVEHGPTDTYGSSTAVDTLSAGSSPRAVAVDLAGLTDDTTIHFRFVATGPDGTTYGPDETLHTASISIPAPMVSLVTGTPTGVHAADLAATADVHGQPGTEYRFEYGMTNAYGSTTATTAVPAPNGSGESALAASLSGLDGGATYHVRTAVKVNGAWTAGPDATFTTDNPVAATISTPTVTTSVTGAHLETSITPGTGDVQWHVEYGSDTTYGSQTATQTLSAGSTPVAITADLTGLPAGSNVHFRFVAVGPDGTTRGPDQVLQTQPAPVVTPAVGTVAASAVAVRAFHVSATVDPQGLTGVQYRYAYGTTTSYGATTDIMALPGDGTAAADLTGLDPATTYHVRLEVRANGTWYPGSDVTATTDPAVAPIVSGTPVTPIVVTTTGATATYEITPGTSDVQWYVEYGTTTGYGTETARLTIPAGSSPVQVAPTLSGLNPGTTYHFRFVAIGADGTTHGPDQTFRTADAPTTSTPPSTTDEGDGATEAEGSDEGDTIKTTQADQAVTPLLPATPNTTNTTNTTTTTTPTATTTTTTTGTANACRAVRLVSRSRGTAVRVPTFVTVGEPLRVTPPKGFAATATVKVDNKLVKVTRSDHTILLPPAAVANGRHTVKVTSGKRVATVVVLAGTCKPVLALGKRGGRTAVTLVIVPGTSAASITVPAAAAKALAKAKLSLTTPSRTATAARLGARVVRAGSTLKLTKIPAKTTAVRITFAKGVKLAKRGLSASVTTAGKTTAVRVR